MSVSPLYVLSDLPAPPDDAVIAVYELRQHAYCARVPYYLRLQPVERKITHKMGQGLINEGAVARLEERRTLQAYDLGVGARSFNVSFFSERLGISGTVDLLLDVEGELIPVDIKDTTRGVARNHRVQLAAYAVLIEEVTSRPVTRGFIYLVPEKRAELIELRPVDKEDVHDRVCAIRRMMNSESMPPATSHRRRCCDCEFQHFCGDIW